MKVFFGIILALTALVVFAGGFVRNGEFIGRTAGLFSKTWNDIWNSGNNDKPIAEIELDVNETRIADQNNIPQVSSRPSTVGEVKQQSKPSPDVLSVPKVINPKALSSTVSPANSSSIPDQAGTSDGSKNFVAKCDFKTGGTPTRQVIINEVAWMGSPAKDEETQSAASNNEWLELKNVSAAPIILSGWQLADSEGKIKITFGEEGQINAQNFYLLERTDDNSIPEITANKIYSGGLANDGAWLRLFDENCGLIDEVNASTGWPGGDNITKQTLERNSGDFSWHTSTAAGGTPKAENSNAAVSRSSSSTSASMFSLVIEKNGNGSGSVTSVPVGIDCGSKCASEHQAGMRISLLATPSAGAVFGGWTGWENCGSGNLCPVIMERHILLTANFDLEPKPPVSNPNNPPQNGPAVGIVVAEIQITGGTGHTTDDFVKIYNPSTAPFNLKGHRLVKRAKTSTGDTSLKSWTDDAFIPAGGYYTWANSSFISLSPSADVSTSGSIANDNGVAIRQGPEDTGTIIDAVGWGEAQNSLVEGSPFPTNPVANQILKRKFVNEAPQDTNNNVIDFEIQ